MNQTTASKTKRTWGQAYKSFLMSSDESIVLKAAPLAIILGSPEVLASNLIPVIGEIADVSGLSVAAMVAYKTYKAVKKYR